MLLFIRKYLFTLFWAIVVMVLCLMPQSSFPKSQLFNIIPHFDKVVHFGLFAILAILMSNESQMYKKSLGAFFFLFLICFVYGFALEVMQGVFTTDRHFEVADGLTDGIGTLVGLLLSYQLHTRYLQR